MNDLTRLSRTLLRLGACGAVALILACTVSVDSEGETQSRALIDRLPAGATAIAWIDVEALQAAVSEETWAEYEEMLEPENAENMERFEEATGVDLRQDMHQMGIAVMPGAADDEPLVLISADFDRDRIEGLLRDAESIVYEGTTMYAFDDFINNLEAAVGITGEAGVEEAEAQIEIDANTDDDAYLLILDETTAAVGTVEGLQILLDVESGRRETLKSDPRMNDLISEVAGQGQVWLVATKATWDEQIADVEAGAGGMMPVPTTAIESIETLTMALRMGDGMTLRLAGITASAEDAAMITESLNGLISMGKMMLQGSEPELFEILDRGVRASQDDVRVNIEANLTEADLEFLRRMAEEQGSQEVVRSGG